MVTLLSPEVLDLRALQDAQLVKREGDVLFTEPPRSPPTLLSVDYSALEARTLATIGHGSGYSTLSGRWSSSHPNFQYNLKENKMTFSDKILAASKPIQDWPDMPTGTAVICTQEAQTGNRVFRTGQMYCIAYNYGQMCIPFSDKEPYSSTSALFIPMALYTHIQRGHAAEDFDLEAVVRRFKELVSMEGVSFEDHEDAAEEDTEIMQIPDTGYVIFKLSNMSLSAIVDAHDFLFPSDRVQLVNVISPGAAENHFIMSAARFNGGEVRSVWEGQQTPDSSPIIWVSECNKRYVTAFWPDGEQHNRGSMCEIDRTDIGMEADTVYYRSDVGDGTFWAVLDKNPDREILSESAEPSKNFDKVTLSKSPTEAGEHIL